MTFKIIWSEFAESQLYEIYEYNEKKANPSFIKNYSKELLMNPTSW